MRNELAMVISWKELNIMLDREKLKNQGIYLITNDTNSLKYVGQSVNMLNRWYSHLRAVNYEKSPEYNSQLHKAMRKIGKEHFTVEVLEFVEDNTKLNEREIYWIAYFDTYKNGYNGSPGGETIGASRPGESNGRALLKESDVFAIREMYAEHIPFREVLPLYEDQITKRGLQKVWHGENWKDIHMDVYTPENKEWHRTKAKGFSQKGIGGNSTRMPSDADIEEMRAYAEEGMSYLRIAEIVPWSPRTVQKYINGHQKMPQNNIEVRNIQTGKEFPSLKAASIWAKCDPQSISKLLKGIRRKGYEYAGTVPDTGEKATWEYI